MRSNTWILNATRKGTGSFYTGDKVEVGDGFISEGAWQGEFSSAGFLGSAFRCGSGVVSVEGGWVVLPPSHCIESIYCFQGHKSILISNSLPAIIALNPNAAPNDLSALRHQVGRSVEGRRRYPRELYRTQSGAMLRFSFNRVFVSDEGAVVESDEGAFNTAAFRDFSIYRQRIQSTLSSVLKNCRDRRRAHPYGELITTCSSGYDSAACAALASELGARKALTLSVGRGGLNDSGLKVAESLGLEVFEYSRFGQGLEEPTPNGKDWVLPARYLEPKHRDFLGTASTAEDLFFADFEEHLAGSVVLTGFHGDSVWKFGCPSGSEVMRGDSSGTGLDEFRKRVGFVNIPIPFIGVQHHEDIARITSSDEMKPWSVSGDYDRPIPRRIAEDAGVSREMFGIKKIAGSILLSDHIEIRNDAFKSLVNEYRSSMPSEVHV